MKTCVVLFVVALAILSLVHDSEAFTASHESTIGRRSLEKVSFLLQVYMREALYLYL
jgi:hypothetical protein